jgi:hypothetical protein
MQRPKTWPLVLCAGLLLASGAPLRAQTPPASRSASRPASQPASLPASQPASQPASLPSVEEVMDGIDQGQDPALSRLKPAPPQMPPIALHDGFALRLMLGMGYHSTVTNRDGARLEIDGARLAFHFAIGLKVLPNFLLHGDIIILYNFAPRFRVDGGPSSNFEYKDTTLYGFGAGGTYYFMPINLFISVALTGGLVQNELSASSLEGTDFIPQETNFGFVGEVLFGKEWYVWRKLAFGLAGQFVGGVVPSKSGEYELTWLGGGLVGTITWN